MFLASLKHDTSGLLALVGFFTGVLALIGSAILGPINSHLVRYQEKPYLSLLGYIAPAVVAILYTIMA
ncbi:MAG: hypothetical protein JWO99_243 [Candidatus Saccharibacteria bacterium]|nr:hypothetical protein [Candidatus Saccharibacteria bacterium]